MAYVPKYLRSRKQLICICGYTTNNTVDPNGWEKVNTPYPRCPRCARARRAYFAENARRHNKNNTNEFSS